MFHNRVFRILSVLALAGAFIGQIAATAKNNNSSAMRNAATPQDIVLVIDTTASMAYETRSGGDPFRYDSYQSGLVSENPEDCNSSALSPCQPMQGVKNAALAFIDTLDFSYDRVSIVALTGQQTDGSAARHPVQVLTLSSDKTAVTSAINGLKVFQPHRCNNITDPNDPMFNSPNDPGVCILFVNGQFSSVICQSMQLQFPTGTYNYAPCPTSNIGGALRIAGSILSGPDQRPDANWVTVLLSTSGATSTDTPANYPSTSYVDGIPAAFPYGYCPANEYYPQNGHTGDVYPYKFCTDGFPSVRHSYSDTGSLTYNDSTQIISFYDPDDYARDRADNLANLLSGAGVTIYTIGLGQEVQSTAKVASGEPPAAEDLLKYIANTAGGANVNHGNYYYAANIAALESAFHSIAINLGSLLPDTATATGTSTKTPTGTATPTRTGSMTFSPSPTRTGSMTFSPSPTRTGSMTFSPSPTRTGSATNTPTPTSTETSPAILTTTFKSQDNYDGWILESSESSNKGGSSNSFATTIKIGDDAANKQYRGILSFDTSAIPANAVITSATLKFKFAGNTGTLPFNTHGNLLADIRKGSFNSSRILQFNDFIASSNKDKVLVYSQNMLNNWFTKSLSTEDFQYINQAGATQFRLRFTRDDNHDFGADFLSIYSGDSSTANKPQLVIQYYLAPPTTAPTQTLTATGTSFVTTTLTQTETPENTPIITPTRTPTVTPTPFNPNG